MSQGEVITTDFNWPLGLAKSEQFLFIAEANDNKISKIDLTDQSNTPEDVITGLSRPLYLEISGDYLYFTEGNSGTITKINFTESNPAPEVVIAGLDDLQDLLLVGNELYYTEYSLGKISKIDITENNPTPILIADNLFTPFGLEIYDGELYFSEYIENRISKIDLGNPGSSPIPVLNGLGGPIGGMQFNGSELYFFQYSDNKFSKVDISLANPVVELVDDVLSGGDILFDNTDIYTSDFENDSIIKYPDELILSINSLNFDSITVFPNPSIDYIRLEGIKDTTEYQIYDIFGRLIQDGVTNNFQHINLSYISSGRYFIHIENSAITSFLKN